MQGLGESEKRSVGRSIGAYSVLFFLAILLIFAAVWVRGNSLVLIGDDYNQYYPAQLYIARYVRDFFPNLLHGSLPMFDPSIGFGDDVIGTLNYYGFGDIFTLVAVFFPDSAMALAYTLIILLRMYFAGLFFLLFFREHGGSDRAGVCGALMYACSLYALGIGLSAFCFTIPLVWFPLMIRGLDQILAGKRESAVLIVSVFLLSLNGFYC